MVWQTAVKISSRRAGLEGVEPSPRSVESV
jgi:hypothetical protein